MQSYGSVHSQWLVGGRKVACAPGRREGLALDPSVKARQGCAMRQLAAGLCWWIQLGLRIGLLSGAEAAELYTAKLS
jgi:hypothetical protein